MSDWQAQVAAKREKKALAKKGQTIATTGVRVNTNGWRSSGNAYLFKLEVNETMVAYYLNKGGMALGATQIGDKYDFEFHPMHTTGYPVYIRMTDNDSGKEIPKFDTKNKKTFSLDNIVNQRGLELSTQEWAELGVLVKANYAFLQYMAKCVYDDDGILS